MFLILILYPSHSLSLGSSISRLLDLSAPFPSRAMFRIITPCGLMLLSLTNC